MNIKEIKSMALVEVDDIEAIKKRLTVYNSRHNYQLNLYRENGNKNSIWIPRGIIKQKADDAGWEHIDIEFEKELKQPQKVIIKNFLTHLQTYPNGGIIQAGTGTGKTVMAIWLACFFKLKTLVIVPNDRIFNQWREKFVSFTNLRDDQIGIIRGKICDYKKPVVVAMLQTIYKDRFDFLEKEFGLVIYDEVHTISTECFNVVVNKFWSKVNIGLSATPTRKDGMENVFLYHIGKIATNSSDIEVSPTILVVNYYNPQSYHGDCMLRGELNLGKYFNKLSKIQDRNRLIAKYIKLSFDKNHNILVLTERLQHIDKLKQLIIGHVKEENIGLLTAKQKEIDKRVILGTYGSAGLGLDIPSLSCLILATPRADIIQAVGRITRVKSRVPIVVDIVDEASRLMMSWFQARLKYYNKISTNIIYVKE